MFEIHIIFFGQILNIFSFKSSIVCGTPIDGNVLLVRYSVTFDCKIII